MSLQGEIVILTHSNSIGHIRCRFRHLPGCRDRLHFLAVQPALPDWEELHLSYRGAHWSSHGHGIRRGPSGRGSLGGWLGRLGLGWHDGEQPLGRDLGQRQKRDDFFSICHVSFSFLQTRLEGFFSQTNML